MMLRLGMRICCGGGLVLALAACGSARFGGGPAPAVARPGPVYNAPGAVEAVPAAPTGPVTSAPLAPPPGAAEAPPPATGPGPGPIIADVPEMRAQPSPVEAMRPASPAPERAAPSGRSSLVGGWTAREASGSTCRVQLSSTSALDWYKASASGCDNRELARITAWDLREGEVFLFQPGGGVAARLRPSGGSLDGVLAKSGAPLTLSR